MKKNVAYFAERKQAGEHFAALTCYDFPGALLMEEAGVDMLVIGDSVGTNVLGYENETQVTIRDIRHHLKAVSRGVKSCFMVADLPFGTHENATAAYENALLLVEDGADSVKLEGRKEAVVEYLSKRNVVVTAHIGLNPQYHQDEMRHGKITRGKTAKEAISLIEAAIALQNAGASFIVLEKIPGKVASIITRNLNIPTIGIGAGSGCDGQVLIVHDILGLSGRHFKHVKQYADLHKLITDAFHSYCLDVRAGNFPEKVHANRIDEEEFGTILEWANNKQLKI